MSACAWTNEYSKDPRGPRIQRTGPNNADASGWKFLHLAALDGKLSQGTALQFASCIGCPDCKMHFLQLIRAHPIRPTERDKAFETTVKWHNSVNRRLGAPAMTIEQAHRLWSGGRVEAVGLVSPGVPQFSQIVTR
jgi:Erv1 / Alr family